MARLRFRATSIALDEEEEVASVTAVVNDDAYRVITDLIGSVETISTARGGTELTIVLPVGDAMDLYRQVGRVNGNDPRHDTTHDIYESLNWIYCSLIDEG